MPSRIVDGPALWRSKKLKSVPAEYRAEYANLLPLAEANGAFEFDVDSIWSDVFAYNRPEITPERCEEILNAFVEAGMISRHEQQGRVYGFFEGIDKPGRLPSAAHQSRYTNLPPAPARAATVVPEPPLVPASPSGNRPIDTEVEEHIRQSIGFVEERIHWKKELRVAVQTHGYDAVLAALDIWADSQRSFTGKRPVTAFLRSLPSLANAGARPAASAHSPALQQVEDAIALMSNSDVVFGNAQKPHLALMVKDHGPDAVIHVFREFWGKLDDYTRKFAARDFLEKGPQFLRVFGIQQVQRQEQEEQMAEQRAGLESAAAAEIASLVHEESVAAALEDEAFSDFE